MNKSIYLVTGAAGFLGGTVCRQLIQRGERVRAFVLPNDKAMKYIPSEAEICQGDLCNIEDLIRFFNVEDDTDIYVLHIASIVTVNPDFNQKVMDVNVGGTQNIISLCEPNIQVKKLVYVSSTGAIPEQPRGQLIEEVTSFDPSLVLGCYSQSKAIATQKVLEAASRGLNASVVHPTGIMGPEDYSIGETTGILIQIIKGEMPAGIAGGFNLCDVRDLASGVIAAVEKGRKGECYILGNEEVSFKDFSRFVSEEAGVKRMKIFIPCKVAKFFAGIMEKRAKKKGTRPLMTTFSVYNLARNNSFNSSKAKTELGFTTRSYRETIHDEIMWLKSIGKIA